MNDANSTIYAFGPFRIDTVKRVLTREDQMVQLSPKAFDTLLALVENSPRVVEKSELIGIVWPDSFVEEINLNVHISALRKALGESPAEHKYIVTVPRRGFGFVAHVQRFSNGDDPDISISGEPAQGTTTYENESAAGRNGLNDAGNAEAWNQVESQEVSPTRRLNIRVVLVAAAIVVAVVAGLVFRLVSQDRARRRTPFQKMRISKLVTTGTARSPALSRDGKYVAYVKDEAGQQSVWIRQVSTASNSMRIVPPAEIWYRGLVFSADGNFLYYVTNENVRSAGALYRVPVLGGTPERVSEGVDSVITVSPDGARIAFVRMNRLERESALMVANTDGSGERALTVRQRPDYFSLDGPSWSPDGSIVAVGEGGVDSSGYYMKVVGINPDDGKESAITSQRWSWLGQISWLGDGRGIVVIGWHQASPIYADQIWHVSYPGGEARRVTNDLNGYSGISVDRDSDSIVTTQTVRVSRICIVPDRDETRSVQVGSGFGDNYSEYLGITWTPDGRIVYGSHASGNPDIWVMDADGANQRQLTFDPHTDLAPAVSPDGRYIVFVSNRAGANNIWRMDADGSDPKQLTYGRGEDLPSITPDGRWVVYADAGRDTPSIWKVAIDGGEPIQITHWVSGRPAVSPDGEWIACHYLDMKSAQVRLAVVPIDGGEPRRMFDTYLPNLQAVRWAPDSKSIRYIDTKTGVSNIWSQPIDGSPPRQLTDFKSDSIYRFAWSPDGRRLACERGVTLSDVILISNLEN